MLVLDKAIEYRGLVLGIFSGSLYASEPKGLWRMYFSGQACVALSSSKLVRVLVQRAAENRACQSHTPLPELGEGRWTSKARRPVVIQG